MAKFTITFKTNRTEEVTANKYTWDIDGTWLTFHGGAGPVLAVRAFDVERIDRSGD